MIEETSEDENESRSLDIQEVFSSDYYDQKILLRNIHEGAHEASHIIQQQDGCRDAASSLGLIDEIKEDDRVEFDECHYSSQTVFDNLVQVEKYSGEEWDNYSMDTASTYDEFRNRLEHGPGIRSSSDWSNNTMYADTAARDENGGDESNDMPMRAFPGIADTEFESIDFHEVELRGSGHAQTIYYFAKDTSTGTEVEVMGVMTEDGFKITEYCNEIPNTNLSIIDSYMGMPADIADRDDEPSRGGALDMYYHRLTARIILLEVVDANEMRFEEYDYSEPVDYKSVNSDETIPNTEVLGGVRAIPFYFDWIPDSDTNETENKSATEEGKKGLNAVNVKVVIAGPSGPYGMEGDLSDYRLVTSNCTLDNKTTGIDATTEADDETTSARSEGTNGSDADLNDMIFGSAGNSCTDIDAYELSDIDGLLEHGIVFVDADSSGTLSEGDRFEFSDNFTCDDCVEANMLRLYSISADGFSDGNINPSSKMSLVHEGAMNAIRNIRAVGLDPQMVDIRLETFRKG